VLQRIDEARFLLPRGERMRGGRQVF